MGRECPWQVSGTVWVVPEVMTLDSSCLWKAKSAMMGGGCEEGVVNGCVFGV